MGNTEKIITTIDDEDGAKRIARQLLEMRLVSCAQIIGPMKSLYWWKGRMEEAEEWLCIFKSRKSLFKDIEREIRKLHTYELPEIIGVDIDETSEEYSNWIFGETAPAR